MTTADQILEEILKLSVEPRVSTAGHADLDLFADYISESTRNVFSTMCALELAEEKRTDSSEVPPGHQVLSMIQFTGGATATIKLSASKDLILDAATAALGDRPENINEDVQDLMGELANMIGGNTKKKLGKSDIRLSLPKVEAQAGGPHPATCSVAITWISGENAGASQGIEFNVA